MTGSRGRTRASAGGADFRAIAGHVPLLVTRAQMPMGGHECCLVRVMTGSEKVEFHLPGVCEGGVTLRSWEYRAQGPDNPVPRAR